MKRVSGVIRIMSAAVDLIIVSFPVIFVMVMYFKVSESQAELMQKLLLAVYGILLVEYMDGATIGKQIGKIKVVTEEGTKPALMYIGMRELFKIVYWIPWIGWCVGLVSVVMMFTGDGRALHDRIGQTRVIYKWQQPEVNQNEL